MRAKLLILTFFLFSCSNFSNTNKFSQYYNIDSLLEFQILNLSQSKNINKVIYWDNIYEEKTLDSKSINWNKELNGFKNLDINQPSNLNAYSILSENNIIEYKKLIKNEGIISLKIIFDNSSNITRIFSTEIENNLLFNSFKTYSLYFDSLGLITKYILEDKQKTIFKDTLIYEISGEIGWD